jgi:hypothetical protein
MTFMKQIKTLFLAANALLLAGGMSSCTKEVISPVALSFGRKYDADLAFYDNDETSRTYKIGNIKNIDYDYLTKGDTSLIGRQMNFVLLVADVTTDCTCFAKFKASIAAYIEQTNAFVYAIAPTEFKDKETLGIPVSTSLGYESIAIFEKGTLRYSRQRAGEEDSWSTDAETFKSWMKARVSVASMLYIDVLQLEKLVADPSTLSGFDHAVVGFVRDACPDCSYLSDHFLKDYNLGEHAESYLIDCDVPGLHNNADGTTNKTQWTAFKVKYGLASSSDPEFGFDTGYVPSFQFRRAGNVIEDAEVYVNDDIALNADGVTCALASTYWDGSRNHPFFESLASSIETNLLKVDALKAIPASDYTSEVYNGTTYLSWNHDKAALYHDPILKGFLDYYLAK